MGCICTPDSAAAMVRGIWLKSATSDRGFFTGSS